jgi:hypothetical protein
MNKKELNEKSRRKRRKNVVKESKKNKGRR